MIRFLIRIGWLLTAVSLGATSVFAKVSAHEAARLGEELTPFGAERAGNTDGSIPGWTGGLTPDHTPAGWEAPKGYRPDPYADDQPLFTMTAQNMGQYADKLTEGLKALFQAYPETFKMHVYPTRRSHALPEWIYQNTLQNATEVELVDGGNGVSGGRGGVLFPIPQNGLEVMWNHRIHYRGLHREVELIEVVVQPNGQRSQYHYTFWDTMPIFERGKTVEEVGGILWKHAQLNAAPPRESGTGFVIVEYFNASKIPRKTWLYSPHDRRVRRAPTFAFDTPDRSVTTWDDYEMFNGSLERYDWTLVGKTEMFVPYNNYRAVQPECSYGDLLPPHHLNPEPLRYELHRVWVVEATVKQGARHRYAKRRFYVDEDSWLALATEKYDSSGNLWRVGIGYPRTFYDVPLTSYSFYTHMDLKNGAYEAFGLVNEEGRDFDFTQRPPPDFFTPQALRRRGR